MKKMYIFFLLLIMGVLYLSCRRELTLSSRNESKINLAKTWFDTYQKTTAILSMYKNTRYHWDKANVFTYENGYQAITVPVTEINQNPDYRGKRSLYLFPWKNGKGYYTTLFEFLPEENHLKEHNGNFDLKTFDGIIASWDLKTGFTAGIQYKNGVVNQRANIVFKKRHDLVTQTVNSTLPTVTVTGYIPAANWGFFWVTLMNSFGYSTSILLGGGGNNPCEYGGCNNNDPYANFDPNAFTEPDNNDDNDDEAEVKDITKNVDDPCLSATLDAATADNMSNKISDMLHNTFGGKADLNINFLDDNLNDPMKDGKTTPFVYSNGRIDFNVTLNTGVLLDASKEYTAATIYHEIIHAYLRTSGVTGQDLQHITMTERYVTQLESSLHSLFPNISDLDAKALSWGGLMDTPAWTNFKTNNPTDAQNLEVANSQHRVHTKGTPCN
jgi:hypothetical protein